MQSPNWIPFYDDGRVVMFGRADAAEPDLAAFKTNRLEPELRAYKVAEPVPPPIGRRRRRPGWTTSSRTGCWAGPSRTPMPPAAGSSGASLDDGPGRACPTPPAACWPSARRAPRWPRAPTTGSAYRLLDAAYRLLTLQETALLAGIPLTPGEPGPDRQAGAEHRGPQHPVPPAGHGPQLRDPDHAPSQDPRGAARAPVAEPRAVPALPPGRLPRPGPRPAAGRARAGRPRPTSRPRPKAQLQQQLDQLNERVKQIEDSLMRPPGRTAGRADREGRLRPQPGCARAGHRRARGGRARQHEPGRRQAAARGPLLQHRPARQGARAPRMGANEDPNLGPSRGCRS